MPSFSPHLSLRLDGNQLRMASHQGLRMSDQGLSRRSALIHRERNASGRFYVGRCL